LLLFIHLRGVGSLTFADKVENRTGRKSGCNFITKI